MGSGEGYPLRFPNRYLGVSPFLRSSVQRHDPSQGAEGPALTAAPPAISQPRQVPLRAAPPEPLSSLKLNKRSLFCAARLRSCGKNSIFPAAARRAQRGLWEMCVQKTGNSLCFLLLERASHFQVDCQRVYAHIFTHVGTEPPWCSLIYAQRFSLIGEFTGTQLSLHCPSVPRCVFYAHGSRGPHSPPHLSHFILNDKIDILPHREQWEWQLQRLLWWSWELSGHYHKKRAAAASINPNMGWKASLAPCMTHLDDFVV